MQHLRENKVGGRNPSLSYSSKTLFGLSDIKMTCVVKSVIILVHGLLWNRLQSRCPPLLMHVLFDLSPVRLPLHSSVESGFSIIALAFAFAASSLTRPESFFLYGKYLTRTEARIFPYTAEARVLRFSADIWRRGFKFSELLSPVRV
jgi:hypothetical protein